VIPLTTAAACRQQCALRGRLLASCILLAMTLPACVGPVDSEWGGSIPEERIQKALASLPPRARAELLPLSQIFYERITSRRFNSRATFEDPSIRQFFPGVAAYSDYYAALVDALDRAHVRHTRPNRVALLDLGSIGEGSLRLELRFVGDNDLPLRFWSAVLERADEWQWRDGRWWVVPGKI